MGMSFGFSEEQDLYRTQLRRFGRDRIVPRRCEWDRDRKSPGPVLREAIELGLVDIEMDYITRGIMVESLSNFFVPRETTGVSEPHIWDDLGSRGSAWIRAKACRRHSVCTPVL